MKALLRKEFRDSLRPGVLGLVICGLLLLSQFVTYEVQMKRLALEQIEPQRLVFQPLDTRDLQLSMAFFCAIFAAVLGWAQVFPERQRGLWGFLVHRPMTPTGIFLAKAAAGLGVYFAAAGLPQICFIGWALAPGNVAAPSKWSGLLPFLFACLSGVPYYFAGMLTGMRQARWYVSRAVGLGAGIAVSVSVYTAPNLWQAVLCICIGTMLLALAGWGSFHTDGFYRGQPALGKPALTLSLALGWTPIAFLAGVMFVNLVSPLETQTPEPARSYSYYSMTKDGTLFKVTPAADKSAEINDLEGNPAKDPRTGAALTLPELERLAASKHSYWRFGGTPTSRMLLYRPSMADFWGATPQTLWYYQADRGRLTGYDVKTRRFIGSLGPKGFAPGLAGAGDRFRNISDRFLATQTGLYLPDLQNRSVKQLFSTEPEDAIVRAEDVQFNQSEGTNQHVWTYTVVLSRQFVRLLKIPDGSEVLKTPFPSTGPDYSGVKLSLLEPRGQFAVWFGPSLPALEKSGWKLPTHVIWFDGSRKKASVELPPTLSQNSLDSLEIELTTQKKFFGCLLPPALIAAIPLLVEDRLSDMGRQSWLFWRTLSLVSLAFSVVVCVPVGYWLTRRYSLPRSAQLGWSAFLLLSGFPGLLALLSVEEWPAREPCPNCKKLRVVCHDHCEHCGATFSAPGKKGTEIFDSADGH